MEKGTEKWEEDKYSKTNRDEEEELEEDSGESKIERTEEGDRKVGGG